MLVLSVVEGSFVISSSCFSPQKAYNSPIMPLTKDGKKVLAAMQKKYGKEKGKRVFYASINKGVKGSNKWHK